MFVSIGILAHNEESKIGATIGSLLRQSAFAPGSVQPTGDQWEIVVVPNGCTDATAAIAEDALKEGCSKLALPWLRHSVFPLERGGKSNAWNEFVHRLSDSRADVLVLVDADIEFDETTTLANCLDALHNHPNAKVAVDLPRKRTQVLGRSRTSARSNATTIETAGGICGQFYCARADTIRSIWMPDGLSVEDGFVSAMVLTDSFRSEIDLDTIIRPAGASHFFEGLTNPIEIFRHELRLTIGTSLNCFLMWDYLSHETARDGPGAGAMIRAKVAADPEWYSKFIVEQVKRRGSWVIPGNLTFRRFHPLRDLKLTSALRRLPVATLVFLADLPLLWMANRMIRRGRSIGYW